MLFELDGKLLQGWYAYPFGEFNSCVTLEPPEQWVVKANGKPMPAVYTRRNREIRPWISPARTAEIQAALDEYEARDWAAGGYWPFGDVVSALPEYHGDDPRNVAIPEHLDMYVLADGSVIEKQDDGWQIRPPRPLSA